jgi:hypothetical protein
MTTMHPFERQHKGTPAGVQPSLQVLLKEGWRLDPGKRSFVTPRGDENALRGILPPRTRVIPLAESLAEADPDNLSQEERYLARHVQVVFPPGADANEYADALRHLEAVEEVRVPPQIELP